MNPRLRRIGGYAPAAAAGFAAAWLALSGIDSETRRPDAPSRDGGHGASRPDATIPLPARTIRRETVAGAGAYGEAWEMLQRRPPAERDALRLPLMLEWMKADFQGALAAALADGNPTELLQAFLGAFEEDPLQFKGYLIDETFGLRTETLRKWWIAGMASRAPEELLAHAADLGPLARESIARACVERWSRDPDRLLALADHVASQPDGAATRELWSLTARSLAGHMDAQALLDHLIGIPGPAGEVMIGDAMAVMMETTDRTGARDAFARLPGDLRAVAIEAVLERPGNSVAGYLAALDEVIESPGWPDRAQTFAVRLHEMAPDNRHTADLLEWAAEIPERDDTMDIYRTAVRGFVGNQPAEARAWIAAMPPGWKQQNSLAAYAQAALSMRNDPAGARWAMEQIDDPVFRRETEGFFRHYEARNPAR